MDLLPIPTQLDANPHFYDYRHVIKFQSQEAVELVDGAGQVFNMKARGQYRIHPAGNNTAEIEFRDLVLINPYEDDKEIGPVDPIRVRVVREKGLFAFRYETFGKIEDYDEWPCLLYHARYVFDVDPL